MTIIQKMPGEGRACANHFGIGHGWLPRAIDSNKRSQFGHALDHAHFDDRFSWFQAPIANSLSRVALTADAGKGRLTLMGTNGTTPVTQVFRI
jgi:hypothetical protein